MRPKNDTPKKERDKINAAINKSIGRPRFCTLTGIDYCQLSGFLNGRRNFSAARIQEIKRTLNYLDKTFTE